MTKCLMRLFHKLPLMTNDLDYLGDIESEVLDHSTAEPQNNHQSGISSRLSEIAASSDGRIMIASMSPPTDTPKQPDRNKTIANTVTTNDNNAINTNNANNATANDTNGNTNGLPSFLQNAKRPDAPMQAATLAGVGAGAKSEAEEVVF